MSVIVQGMDLPQSCFECDLETEWAKCSRFPDREVNYQIRPAWCPLRYYPDIPPEDKCPFCAGRLLPPIHGKRRCGSCNFEQPESRYPYKTFDGIPLNPLPEDEKERLLKGNWTKAVEQEDDINE